jgi:AraC-like DNA-binding protein
MGGIVYYWNVVSYQREITETNLTKMTQVRNQIDLELKSLKEIVYHISSQSELYTDGPRSNPARSSLIVPQLEAYKGHYPFIEDILFYYRGDSKVYLTTGTYDYDVFENGIHKDYAWSQAQMFKELNAVDSPKPKRIQMKESALSRDGNMIAFLYPVPYLQTIPEGTVLFTVKESDFLSKFENILGDIDGAIFIYDQYYNSLVSVNHNIDGAGLNGMEEELRSTRGTGVSQVEIDDSDMTVIRMVSEEMNWSYIIAMPDSFFYKRVHTLRAFIVGIIVILIVTGLFGAFLFSRRNYKPIQLILSLFRIPEYEAVGVEGKNELETIRFTFESALRRNKEMLVEMNAQRPFIKDQCLLYLIRGKAIDPGERDYLIKCSNLMLEGDAYCCLVLSSRQGDAERADLDGLITLLENSHHAGGRCYGVEIVNEKAVAVVTVLQEYPEDGKSKRREMADSMIRLAYENLGLGLAIGIGKLYTTVEQLNASYLEASAVLFDNQVNDRSSVHFFDDIENIQEQVHWYPIKEQALYMQSLKQGDLEVAQRTLQALIGQMKTGTTSYLMVRCLCFDIVNHILKTINQMNFQSFSGDIKELVKFNSLKEFQTNMEAFTESFCTQVNQYKEKQNVELKNSIITYINDNFKNSNLSLEHMAGQFSLSVSYLSRFIKEETGVTFLDYLTSLRMNEAKLQLQYTDKLINVIVTDVGYLNTPSFVRKFKAMEGVTPGQYREITADNR